MGQICLAPMREKWIGSSTRSLKPEIAARIGNILFADQLVQVLIEFMQEFRRHSAAGMVANKMFQLISLTGHRINELNSINVLK